MYFDPTDPRSKLPYKEQLELITWIKLARSMCGEEEGLELDAHRERERKARLDAESPNEKLLPKD